ncbi:MAG: PH domain-containing protein [[Eubacterium] sulci]|nr:PH domain-containing protein [[Eubacterium] sulci]
MATELTQSLTWTFISECPISGDVSDMLVNGETAVAAYKTIRDVAVFTSKRLIVKDAQGLTGKKIEIYSLPYSSIVMWSTENAGKLLDLSAEVELWTKAGHVKVKLSKNCDVRKFDILIANATL